MLRSRTAATKHLCREHMRCNALVNANQREYAVDCEESMEISQRFTGNWLARQSVQALEDRVIVRFKNLLGEGQEEFVYSDLKSKVDRGRTGDSGWSSVGSLLIAVAIVLSLLVPVIFPQANAVEILRVIVIGLVALALIAFALRFGLMFDYASFYTSEGNHAFTIKLAKEDRHKCEELVNYILQKVSEARTLSSKAA